MLEFDPLLALRFATNRGRGSKSKAPAVVTNVTEDDNANDDDDGGGGGGGGDKRTLGYRSPA